MSSQPDAQSVASKAAPSSSVPAAAAAAATAESDASGGDAGLTPTTLTPSDRLSSVDDYGAVDVLLKPVIPRCQSASRYRRIDGEPSLAFFRRERNSLSAYCRPTQPTSADYGSGEDDWDEAMNRLEKRAVMSGAVRDESARGGYLGNDRRYEVRNQRVQREKRQSIKHMRAARLMQTLKFLLTMKSK